jgi:hypothetical protein
MPPPTLTSFAQALYDELEPLTYDEPDYGYALAKFCAAVAVPYDEMWEILVEGDVPWGPAVDLDLTPSDFLDWLGRFKGVAGVVGLADSSKRARIRSAEGFSRGTVTAMVTQAKTFLSGANPTVLVSERYGGNAYQIKLQTLDSETPDDHGPLVRAIRKVKAAGLVLTFTVAAQIPTFADIATYASFSELPLRYYDFDDMRSRVSHGLLLHFSDLPGRYPTFAAMASGPATFDELRKLH